MTNTFNFNELSIIVLVYNESKSIDKDINNLKKHILDRLEKSELIIVEDHSKDDTFEILKKYHENVKVEIIRGKQRLGYKQSLIEGLKKAKYKNIFFTESGCKYDFSEFINFSKNYNSNKIFSGFRSPRYDGLNRKILTYGLNFFIRIFFKFKIFDSDSGYKLMSKEKYNDYYIKKGKFNDFGSSEMIIRMASEKEIIEEKKISYYQRPDASKQFDLKRIIFKSFKLFLNLIKLKVELHSKKNFIESKN